MQIRTGVNNIGGVHVELRQNISDFFIALLVFQYIKVELRTQIDIRPIRKSY